MEKNTLPEEVRAKADSWLKANIDQETRGQILRMLEHDENELIESFYRNLEFGTGGLRGIMGAGTNRMNIYTLGMATQGLSNYLKKCFSDLRLIKAVIAHDSRNNSRLYAETTANIFSANGIKAYLFDDLRPTPELSFAIRHFGCQAGVVITASHNPKEYNGYKVYWDDGGQIISPHDKNIIDEVEKITSIDEINFDVDQSRIEIIGTDLDQIYVNRLAELSLSPDIVRKHHDLKIVYTPIHGTGVRLVPMALKKFGFTNVYNVPEQDITDGNFPTVHSPNPEESAALSMALKKADDVGADLVMATDPDADRVGIAVRDTKGNLVLLNGNQTGSLLIYYLINKWAETGRLKGKEYIVKTIVTTELMADIAKKYNVETYDVLTGFKYIADIMKINEGRKSFIAGAEESYGYLAGEFVRDKDAVMSCTLIAETAAWAKENGKSLYELLLGIYTEYGLYRENLMSIYKEGKSGAEEIRKMMDNFRNKPPDNLGGSSVVAVHDYLKQETLDINKNARIPLSLPKSNVLQYLTEDSSKISIRPSGTEPKIKFYFSVTGKFTEGEDLENANRKLDEKIQGIKKELGIG
ncbi:MAG: phosphoglucomutase [Bacteroides sp. SM23_62_1]|nr:MAG: phosphoglucomutase [Bacteroides sp. SM23_62_1]